MLLPRGTASHTVIGVPPRVSHNVVTEGSYVIPPSIA